MRVDLSNIACAEVLSHHDHDHPSPYYIQNYFELLAGKCPNILFVGIKVVHLPLKNKRKKV